ncbi:MAG: CHASE domain-containing protein [Nitrospinae bacterium]|nr:CHASE domain-containing protein [Nitrospinota bacterium]
MERSGFPSPSSAQTPRFMGGLVAALLVLLIALLSVTLAWHVVRKNMRDEAKLRLESRVEQVRTAISSRMQGYEQVLLGGAGLFAASDSVKRNEWRDYVESLKISGHYPGIQGVGFARRIVLKEKAAHTRAIRAEGFPLYSVRPEGERSEYYPGIYLEPFRDRNLRAFGYDMFSEEVRRAAMIRARDTGGTAITGKVRLVQETVEAPQAGFLMYIPVYKNGAPHHTPEERRKNITGFVYSPFRMNDLMTGILGQANPDIDLEIYDGQEASPSALMYDDHPEHGHTPLFERITRLEMGGAVWTLKVGTLPPFEDQMETGLPLLVLAGGIFVSLLLAAITWSVSTTGERAQGLANRMTQALRESEERYRAIFDHAAFGIMKNDMEGRFLSVNPAIRGILGYSAEELKSLRWPDITHPDDLAKNMELFNRLKEGASDSYSLEKRYRAKDGNYIWVRVAVTAMKNTEGKAESITAIVEDIAAQRAAADALRHSEERFRLLVESSPFCIHEIDMAGRLQSMNRAGLDMMGLKMEKEVCGMEYLAAVGEPDKGRIEALLKQAYRGTSSHFEFVSSGANPLHFRSCFVPIKDRGGNVMKLMGITEDISERERAAEAIRRSEERYRLLVEGGLVIAWELDLSTWLFTFVSQYAEQVLGYPQEDWYKPNFWVDHLHPDDRDDALNYCVSSTKMGRDHTFEYRMIAKDGRVLWFRDLVSVIKDAEGKAVALRGFLLDITERKQAEEELRKAKEQAEEATKTKDKFMSLVAHDLRTPLASIVGFGKLLASGNAAPKETEIAEHMLDSAENAVRLIDELLTVSRLHMGSLQIRRTFMDGFLTAATAAVKGTVTPTV